MKFAFLCKERKSVSGFRIAVVGSGAAGLSAAGYLVCRGHDVEFYEKLPLPGGLMTFAIPKSRIPLESVMEGVEDLERNFSVKFNLGVKVCCSDTDEGDHLSKSRVSLSELSKDYDAVLIATGTWRSRKLNLEGEDSANVLSAIDYLMRLHSDMLGIGEPLRNLERVVVIGGGLSAVDAAEESINVGASEVYLVYRRTISEAPAGEWEVRRLISRGVRWVELAAPKRILAEGSLAKGVEFLRMRLGEPDETGRPRPVPIEGSEFTIEADMIVKAIGELPTPPASEELSKFLDEAGRLRVNGNFNIPGTNLFAAGDVVSGPSKIGRAVKQGLNAAKKIDELLAKGKVRRYEHGGAC
ncbi:MAG: FAD-dependent oxidoreductase [Candidatus Korarchaeum sp.]|nr:FAD-dependent oxidoreductase [Candidatus Korarchaeum sp.]MDW8035052.1 FAD-dependent oxidoreductase [Candidatus Korarchaeum sp.]